MINSEHLFLEFATAPPTYAPERATQPCRQRVPRWQAPHRALARANVKNKNVNNGWSIELALVGGEGGRKIYALGACSIPMFACGAG